MNGQEYVGRLRDKWADSCDGRDFETWLADEVAKMHEDIRNWSYCMDVGMRDACPEKVEELCDMLMGYGIAPYSMRSRG